MSKELQPMAVQDTGHVISVCKSFKPTTFIQNCIYMNFRKILTEIYINFSRQSDRCIVCIVQRLRFSGFILYPLSFFLHSSFKLYYSST